MRASWWGDEECRGKEMGGSWWKEMEGKYDWTAWMYGDVDPVLKEAWVMRMVTEKGGLSWRKRFPSSTMDMR